MSGFSEEFSYSEFLMFLFPAIIILVTVGLTVQMNDLPIWKILCVYHILCVCMCMLYTADETVVLNVVWVKGQPTSANLIF